MLQGMAGSTVGIWVAHGEGRCLFPDSDVEKDVLANGLAPVRYASAGGGISDVYPENPNGSPHGIAALCSRDGRHLAMMPHPERCAPVFVSGRRKRRVASCGLRGAFSDMLLSCRACCCSEM
jgi:phosphoribosylformylglycinamidine (FGAM) synthase-like amidotransferase family enzyme